MKVQGLLSEVLLSTQTDERLCALVSSGHPSAFAVLADRHRAALLRTAARVGGQDGAEDVVQDALLQAWKGLTDGVEVRHARAWLHQIVRHTAINHGRRRVGVEPLPDELASPQVIADQLADRELARSVLAEIAALPERQREALIATEFGDLSRSEIAAELGVSEGAVRQLVHRARDSLRLAFSALVPYPLIAWFLRPRSSLAERLARALAPANRSDLVQNLLTAPRGGGVLLRGGAVLLAAGAAGTVVIPHLAAQGPAQHVVTQQQPAPGGSSQGSRAGKPSLLANGAGPLAPGSHGKSGASVPLLPGLEPEAAARVHEDVGSKRSRADAVELAAQAPERAATTESSQTQTAGSGDANGSDGASPLSGTTAVTSGDHQAGSSSAGSTDQTTATSPATAGSGSGDTATVPAQTSTSSATSGGDGAPEQGSSSQQGTDTTSSSDN